MKDTHAGFFDTIDGDRVWSDEVTIDDMLMDPTKLYVTLHGTTDNGATPWGFEPMYMTKIKVALKYYFIDDLGDGAGTFVVNDEDGNAITSVTVNPNAVEVDDEEYSKIAGIKDDALPQAIIKAPNGIRKTADSRTLRTAG